MLKIPSILSFNLPVDSFDVISYVVVCVVSVAVAVVVVVVIVVVVVVSVISASVVVIIVVVVSVIVSVVVMISLLRGVRRLRCLICLCLRRCLSPDCYISDSIFLRLVWIILIQSTTSNRID